MRHTVIALGLLLFAGCSEEEPPAPPPVTPEAKTAIPPRQAADDFRITEGQAGLLIWDKREKMGAGITILFDNGLGKPVTVAMSEKEKFEVAAKSHRYLKAPLVELHIRIRDAEGRLIERIDFTPEPEFQYVVNAGAVWDYCVHSKTYSNAQIPETIEDPYEFLNALSFFRVKGVTHWLEGLPDKVTGVGFEGAVIIETRTSLTRMDPKPERKVWIVGGPGGSAARMIRDEDGRILVQRVGSTVRPDRAMHAVSYLDDPVQLFVDGFPVKEIDIAGVDLVLEKGRHKLRAVFKSGKTREAEIDMSEEYPTFEIDEEGQPEE